MFERYDQDLLPLPFSKTCKRSIHTFSQPVQTMYSAIHRIAGQKSLFPVLCEPRQMILTVANPDSEIPRLSTDPVHKASPMLDEVQRMPHHLDDFQPVTERMKQRQP